MIFELGFLFAIFLRNFVRKRTYFLCFRCATLMYEQKAHCNHSQDCAFPLLRVFVVQYFGTFSFKGVNCIYINIHDIELFGIKLITGLKLCNLMHDDTLQSKMYTLLNYYLASGGRQAAIRHHYFPFCAIYQLFSLLVAMSHYYFPFSTTTFDSSGQNYFFKLYIQDLLKNPAASHKKAQLKPFFQFYLRLIFCVLKLFQNEIFDKFY